MPARESGSLTIAPLFLRLALGLTFVWAGLGKLTEDMPVKGDAAATLANLGVIERASPSSAPAPAIPETKTPPEPTKAPPAKPAAPDTKQPDAKLPQPKPTETKPADKPADKPPAPPQPAPETPKRDPSKGDPTGPTASDVEPAIVLVSADATRFTAADFPDDVKVRRVYGLALLLSHAAHPPADDKGATPMPLWPGALAQDHWPVYMAWAAAITELLGGVLVLVGLLTRLSAFSLAVVIFTAAWLTQIGPAMQAGNPRLGFLPNHDLWATDAAGNAKFATLMWQFMLGMSALSLTFLGSGALGFDRALFMPAAPPAPKPAESKPAEKK